MATAYLERKQPMTTKPKFKFGQRVVLNGKPGSIEYIYTSGDWYNIRLDKGDLKFAEAAHITLEPVQQETAMINPTGHNQFQIDAIKAVVKLARTKKTFTTDDVWSIVGDSGYLDPRALGAIMTSAAGQGAIKATGRYKPSKRPECHKRPVRVWKSLMYAGK